MDEKTDHSSTRPDLPAPLCLHQINLQRDADLCVEIRKDSFIQSYGSAHKFLGDDQRGAERYLAWLQEKMSARPGSCCHVWLGQQVVGQVEVGCSSDDPNVGWVFLVYVIPAWRRRGVGAYILMHAERFLCDAGFRTAGLRVGRTNSAAIALYSLAGWRAVENARCDQESMVMTKFLSS